MAGGPSWQGCAQIVRKGISQPLPRTTYRLSWYLLSALLPGKQNKLTCLHEHGRMHWRQRFCSNFSKYHILLYRRKCKTEFIPELDYSYCVLKHHTFHFKAPGVGGTDYVTTIKYLSNLFCFNCTRLITALQIPTAWGNQDIYFPQDNHPRRIRPQEGPVLRNPKQAIWLDRQTF